MKTKIAVLVVLSAMIGLCTQAALAQATGSVKGVAKDVDGKPIAGAVVQLISQDTGRKYEIKTNGKGEYFSLGIAPGKYQAGLLKDGKEIFHFNGFPINLDENTLDFDLKKEQQNQAAGQGVNPEELKKRQAEVEKATKENTTIKGLNEKLGAAAEATKTGDFDSAVKVLTEATEMDPTRDLVWFKLGDAYRSSATKQTDAAEKTKRLDSAVSSYQKAVDLKQKSLDAEPAKKPEDTKRLAAYYNNLGEALAKTNKADDAAKAYAQAAQLDPTGAGQYYFNTGAVLTNAGKVDDAIVAFDKALAADPTKADAYYWKGVNMIGKATLKGDKMIAPDGTAEAFNKYLELQPTGQFADPAKQMLASIGAPIETSFGKKKAAAKK